jgi:hypothetical protein
MKKNIETYICMRDTNVKRTQGTLDIWPLSGMHDTKVKPFYQIIY